MQGFPGRMMPGNNGPMGMPGGMPGAMQMPQQPGLNADLQSPFNKALSEYMFRRLVPEDQRQKVLESIIYPLITKFREQCKATKKENASNPNFSELVISGQFKEFVEGGVQYINYMANEVAKMDLFNVEDIKKNKPDKPKGGSGNIILPE